jgi:anti-sigma factor RsiW
MNGRGAFSAEELLSGYLDGELSDEQRRFVEQQLEDDPALRERCRALSGLGERLRMLERYRLSDEAAGRLASAIQAASAAGEREKPAAGDESELISAWVDGELSDSEQVAVQQRLAEDELLRRLFERLSTLQRRLALMPSYRLDDGFAARVIRQIESTSPGPSGTSTEYSRDHGAIAVASRRVRRPRAVAWRAAFWTIAAIATAILLMVFVPRGVEPTGQPVAENSRMTIPLDAVDPPVDTPPAVPEAVSPDPEMSPFRFVSSLRNVQLVLVYEVLVTEEGVSNAAFSHLLRRHGIGFAETAVIKRREQEELLQQRFLHDVQIADQRAAEMDRVDLFLVRTTGQTADAIYADLKSRPAGIGGFVLNLTTRGAESQVLNRLCQSTSVEEKADQAIQLLANFGILSSAARRFGAFGTVEWVDPVLYEIPESHPEPPGQEGDLRPELELPSVTEESDLQQPPAEPLDFACELLFVVRQAGVHPRIAGQP